MEDRLSELQDQVRYNQQHLNELRAAAISIRATQGARRVAHADVNTLNGRIPTAANLHQEQNQAMVSYASAPLVTTSPSPAQPEASVQAALSLLYGPAPSARSKRPAAGSLKERKQALTNQEVQYQNHPSVELPY